MTRQSIVRLQEQLRLIAHYGNKLPLISVDGIYGEETANAVKEFQKLFGLPATGEIDFDTWETINEVYVILLERTSSSESLRPFTDCEFLLQQGDISSTVLVLQIMLDSIAKEFKNLKRVKPTGVYDKPTVQAVKALQTANALEPAGSVDNVTWNALTRLFNTYHKQEC